MTLLLALGGCALEQGGEQPPQSPVRACEDMGHAIGFSLGQCGGWTPTMAEQHWLALVGGCATVQHIRDMDSLYHDCIPAIERYTCEQWARGEAWPSSCDGQLVR